MATTTALLAANWLLGKLLNKLSEDLVGGYEASCNLGLNMNTIKETVAYAQALLQEAQRMGVGDKPDLQLQRLLDELSDKAYEAEDALDELHYFMIQDQLDGTREAAPDVGAGLAARSLHARHAARYTAGNWFSSCFSCCPSQDGVAGGVSHSHSTHDTSKAVAEPHNHTDGGHAVGMLPFDRVVMSNKIKLLIDGLRSKCNPISDMLKIINPRLCPQPSIMSPFAKRSHTSSLPTTREFFGRKEIFEKTMNEIITAQDKGGILSVLPIVGPGGIGKTTFTQHLYNDTRIKDHFPVRVWICVSTNFDLLKLTQEILGCLDDGKNKSNNLDKLQLDIASILNSKRFLIVFDDIWECNTHDEWEKLLAPFTKGGTSGNMILVTTRFPKIAKMVTREANQIELHGLEPDEFWKLFLVCIGEIQDQQDTEELLAIARDIAEKLKCSPLAAKTVGPLLRNKQSREHWMEILENKEWLKRNKGDNIIPALKISYDYLPFHLQKCFSHLSLFPEDYKFHSLDISHFWNAIGLLEDQNDKIEDIGSKYLDELVDNGFLMKEDDNSYVMHDLLHDLSIIVSSKECAYINYSSFRTDEIPPSIHHLSISMQNKYNENFKKEMSKLKNKIDIGNLRSSMIFGYYSGPSIKVIKDTFDAIKSLRVLFISMHSDDSWPDNFSKLIHLQYLKVGSDFLISNELCIPSVVSRFYHLKFLDLSQLNNSCDLPKDISRLVNLRHFIAKKEFHSNIPKVGQIKFLQELKEFHVKKESDGFELEELGKLEELGGDLCIRGLENVKTSREANEAKLTAKTSLITLRLVWSREQLSIGDDIIENLQPHSYLRGLCIVNHRGATSPSWLCSKYMKKLERLHLKGVSWSTLPPFAQMYHLRELKLKNITGICQFGPDYFGGVTEKSFKHLKEVEFHDMPELMRWVGGACLFSRLEIIYCVNCPKLTALPFSGFSSSSSQGNTIQFPNLRYLHIDGCPKLCLPPLPHTPSLSSFRTEYLRLSGTNLQIKMTGGVAFHNLREVETLVVDNASLISFTDLKRLRPLRSIEVEACEEAMFRGLDDGAMLRSVQSLTLWKASLSEKLLSNVFKCFPALSRFSVGYSDEDHDEVILQFPPSTSLREACFSSCKNLVLPVEDGGGFQGLLSLESADLDDCGKLFSRWSMEEAAQSTKPFPACLKSLRVKNEQSSLPMGMLSNLTSLTRLELLSCKGLSVDGFNPLITFNLKNLKVYASRKDETEPYSIAADLFAEVARITTMPAGSFGLVELVVDSIAAVLVDPICRHLSTTLKILHFENDWRMPRNFTGEQDRALQLLTSLQNISFKNCRVIQSLPQGLRRLPDLREFYISGHEIRSLPKNGLPNSLEVLGLYGCCAGLYEECQELS